MKLFDLMNNQCFLFVKIVSIHFFLIKNIVLENFVFQIIVLKLMFQYPWKMHYRISNIIGLGESCKSLKKVYHLKVVKSYTLSLYQIKMASMKYFSSKSRLNLNQWNVKMEERGCGNLYSNYHLRSIK